MRLQIVGIFDRGIANQERLYLRALADTNLHFFVVLHTVYQAPTAPLLQWMTPQQINRFPRHMYWFGARDVRAGDHIVLYTGPGPESQEQNVDGHMNHFFRWGLPETIWNGRDSCAVVMEISQWQATPYGV